MHLAILTPSSKTSTNSFQISFDVVKGNELDIFLVPAYLESPGNIQLESTCKREKSLILFINLKLSFSYLH